MMSEPEAAAVVLEFAALAQVASDHLWSSEQCTDAADLLWVTVIPAAAVNLEIFEQDIVVHQPVMFEP